MYNKNKILSAATAVAILASGALAYDMTKGGAIFAANGGFEGPVTATDIKTLGNTNTAVTLPEHSNAAAFGDYNGATKTSVTGSTVYAAKYLGGVEANETMVLSDNRQGDALIYPAFKGGDGWNTEIVVRNTQNVAVVAKAVLYAANDSRELIDFNIYLTPYDTFRFDISKDGVLTTSDGSYVTGVDPTYVTDNVSFVKHGEETFEIGKLPEGVTSGYSIIYGMIQSTKADAYHEDKKKLYQDYRRAMDLCRDSDGNFTNNNGMTQWRRAYSENGVVNGTFTLNSGVGAPNVGVNCTTGNTGKDGNDINLTKYPLRKGSTALLDPFTSPSKDALFGSVRIAHTGDNRDLLLSATAIDNFTAPNQMMLWATGEYASIQDRRIKSNLPSVSDYNGTGVERDADTFKIAGAYYTFNKDADNVENNKILITQPMKRPLIQLGNTDGYWSNVGTTKKVWGDFVLNYKLYDDNEKEYAEAAGLTHITSPYNSSAVEGYINELQELDNLEEDTDLIKGVNGEYFNHKTNGYADITVRIPAIVTQMSSSKVGNEAQLNWIYSTTR
jgi:hypothetical protein